MTRRKISPEELELWQHVAKSVRPIKRAPKKTGPKKPSTDAALEAKSPPAPPGKMKKTKAPPPPTAAPAPPPAKPHHLTHGLSHGIDRRQAERFRKGKLEIEGKIDLHGRTQQAAHDDLLAFLKRAHGHGKRCVLVVTGKGMTSSKTGVLRQAVPRWLNEPGFRSLVLAFDYAEPHHGGEGALYVLLKRVRE
jgi:DNA-nicking Smr family endonuclease